LKKIARAGGVVGGWELYENDGESFEKEGKRDLGYLYLKN
jgi:hypothetical protein